MNVNFQTIHFDAKADLEAFVQKKVVKLEQYSDQITNVDIAMKVVKPEVANNKEVMLKVLLPARFLCGLSTNTRTTQKRCRKPSPPKQKKLKADPKVSSYETICSIA